MYYHCSMFKPGSLIRLAAKIVSKFTYRYMIYTKFSREGPRLPAREGRAQYECSYRRTGPPCPCPRGCLGHPLQSAFEVVLSAIISAASSADIFFRVLVQESVLSCRKMFALIVSPSLASTALNGTVATFPLTFDTWI